MPLGRDEIATVDELARRLGLSPVLARVLVARGFRDLASAQAFLEPRLEHAHSPWRMRGMGPAVQRILAAVAGGESIRICGDYDADGITAVVILRQALAAMGARVDYRLPHRIADGYGLSAATVDRAHADGVRLLVTVDTGIREMEALARAQALGLDAIVTDHHLPGPELPPAGAILNPHQPGCGYPNKALTGAGIAFKLVQALLERSGRIEPGAWPPRLESYLKLVAIGTIADAAPLTDENRILAAFGVAGLADARNPGLRALLQLAMNGRDASENGRVRAHDIGFRIAPRLNAAGRMGSADTAVELFFAPPPAAAQLALELETLNQHRREAGAELVRQLEVALTTDASAAGERERDPVAVFAGEGWHRGVLGIAATRLMQHTGRAVAIASIDAAAPDGPRAYGSGRAPAGFHLLDLFERCHDLFDSPTGKDGETSRYGGHAQALGFSLPAAKLDELRARLNQAARAAGCAAPAPPAPARSDAEIELAEIDAGLIAGLRRMEPFGEGNREPVFSASNLRLASAPQVLKELHLKLRIEQDGREIEALMWRALEHPKAAAELAGLQAGDVLELKFRVEASSHPRFGDRIQLIVEELRRAATAGA